MGKIMISYKTVQERERIIKALSTGTNIKKISKTYETGEHKRVYINVE